MKDGARALGLPGTRTTRSRVRRAMRASQPARRDSLVHTGSREPPPAEEEPAAEDEEGEGAKEPKPPKIVYPPYEEPGTPASRRARRPASQPARLSLESGQHCAQAPSAPSGAASGHAWLGLFAYLAPNAFSSLLHRLGRRRVDQVAQSVCVLRHQCAQRAVDSPPRCQAGNNADAPARRASDPSRTLSDSHALTPRYNPLKHARTPPTQPVRISARPWFGSRASARPWRRSISRPRGLSRSSSPEA